MSSRNIYVHTVVLMLAIRVITRHPTAMICHRTNIRYSHSISAFKPLSSCFHTQDTDARWAYSTEINGVGKVG